MKLHTLIKITTMAIIVLSQTSEQTIAAPTKALVCVGSYSTSDKDSVHLFQLNLKDGRLNKISAINGIVNPSFIKIHPNGKFLYAVNEVGNFKGNKTGGVTAFALDVKQDYIPYYEEVNDRSSVSNYVTKKMLGDQIHYNFYG